MTEITTLEAATPDGLRVMPAGSWSWDYDRTIHLTDGRSWPVVNADVSHFDALSFRATFVYGYADVPDDLTPIICGVVNRTLWGPMSTGVVAENIGEYSYQMQQGMGTQGTAVRLLPRDRVELADLGYRPPAGGVTQVQLG